MSVIFKKIGGHSYAYQSYRTGGKVVHKYLGKAASPKVRLVMETRQDYRAVPRRLDRYFWDTDPRKIDLHANAPYVIERLLEMGSLDAVEWLRGVYPTSKLIEYCRASRRLSAKSRRFWELCLGGVHAA